MKRFDVSDEDIELIVRCIDFAMSYTESHDDSPFTDSEYVDLDMLRDSITK